ncbi:MAG: hypothetical protein ACAH83_17545 [Alphaproteobacteria bacterium]
MKRLKQPAEKMKKINTQVLHRAQTWGIAVVCTLVMGTASVTYAYSGEQIPKTPTTQLVLALATSFGAK